jgi:hypothetical protein
LLATAIAAVNTWALCLTAEADAAKEQAVRALLPLRRAAPASKSGRVQMVREGLQQLHAAAVKGELAEAGLQQKVHEAIRCLAAAARGGQQATAGGMEQHAAAEAPSRAQ